MYFKDQSRNGPFLIDCMGLQAVANACNQFRTLSSTVNINKWCFKLHYAQVLQTQGVWILALNIWSVKKNYKHSCSLLDNTCMSSLEQLLETIKTRRQLISTFAGRCPLTHNNKNSTFSVFIFSFYTIIHYPRKPHSSWKSPMLQRSWNKSHLHKLLPYLRIPHGMAIWSNRTGKKVQTSSCSWIRKKTELWNMPIALLELLNNWSKYRIAGNYCRCKFLLKSNFLALLIF